MAGAATSQVLDLARRAQAAEQTVDEAFEQRKATELRMIETLRIGDVLACILLRGTPANLEQLRRLAEKWQRLRQAGTRGA